MQHAHDLSPWQHRHDYASDRGAAERRTHWVIAITLVMMVAEIGAGWWWHSMALLDDGWHMGTHAAAIGVAAVSYALARRWAGDARFSLGPWKVEVLGAYTSAVLLGVVALGIAVESGLRLWQPRAVAYDESLIVAVIGLVVNAVCAKLLHGGHDHHGHVYGHAHADSHGHAHGQPHSHDTHDHRPAAPAQAHASAACDHDHSPQGDSGSAVHPVASHDEHAHHGHVHEGHHHHPHPPHHAGAHLVLEKPAAPRAARSAAGGDLNLRAAYLHVLADAATSVLAIGALLAGKLAGIVWLDALVGVLGAVLIASWSIGLLRQTSRILLDREMDDPVADQVRQRLESDGDARVADLHLWRVGDARFAVQATLVADAPLAADTYRQRLSDLPSVAHASIEINCCPDAPVAIGAG